MTPRERGFALAYVTNGGNTMNAAKEAGFTDRFAKSKSFRLLEKPEIIAEIKRLRLRANQKADKTATDVVNEFSKIAFINRVEFLKEDPIRPGEYMYKSPDELTDEQTAVVEKVNMTVRKVEGVTPDGNPITVHRQEYRYILPDKTNALTQMGRHFGIFEDKLKLGVSQANPFTNVSQKQLEELKSAFVKTMNAPRAIDGQFEEVPNGK
jgi:hypothetical protein